MAKTNFNIKRARIVVVMLILWSLSPKAQNTSDDSLLHLINTSTADSIRINGLRQIAKNNLETDPSRSIIYGLRALGLAQKGHDRIVEAECAQVVGIAYDLAGNMDSCFLYLNKAKQIYEELNDISGQANILNDIGAAYHYRGNYQLALRNYLVALDYKRRLQQTKDMAPLLNNVGLIYRSKKDYPTAIDFYKQSVAIKLQNNDEKGLVSSYMNIGSLFHSSAEYDSAYYYGMKCLQLAEKLNLMQDAAGAKSNIGKALFALNRIDEGERFTKQAMELAKEYKCRDCYFAVYENLGNIESHRRNYLASFNHYISGLEHARSLEHKESMMSFYSKLASAAYNLGNFRLAYNYQDSAYEISTRMFNEESVRQINEMNTLYETSEREREIAKLNIEKEKDRILLSKSKRERNYFLFIAVLFLALTLLAFQAYRINRKKNLQLNRQKEIISKSLHEKEILLKEIHHRVKNNLQIVSSLLSLQSDYIKDELALDAVRESRNRVHAMALIHQKLYQEENLTVIKVQDYINNLCTDLFDSYRDRKSRITLVKNLNPVWLDVEVVIPLGLILNELITNCLKYAFPDGKQGTLNISLEEKDNKLELQVSDDGVGMPDDFDTSQTNTFGYKMIRAFIHKMKGELKLYTDRGTRVVVLLSQYKNVAHG